LDVTTSNPPRFADHRVEQAEPGDAAVLAQVVADAFFGLAVSRWLVPDPRTRRTIFPGYFRIYVDHALDAGLVLTTPARDATALWMPVRSGGPGEPGDGYHDRLAAITGQHLARFVALDEQFADRHPTGVPHEHLAILAVRPDRQRRGIGTALMNARHAILDRGGTPAYLEASDRAKRDIYRAHDYADIGEPIQLPDGPSMYPMWRHPRA
jgi:ribosomal protein S18 acetylase RimI-like enzyme